jgi:hypothetical protein
VPAGTSNLYRIAHSLRLFALSPIETDPLAGGLRPWNGPRDQSRRCNPFSRQAVTRELCHEISVRTCICCCGSWSARRHRPHTPTASSRSVCSLIPTSAGQARLPPPNWRWRTSARPLTASSPLTYNALLEQQTGRARRRTLLTFGHHEAVCRARRLCLWEFSTFLYQLLGGIT